METSILKSIKKVNGVADDYTVFDLDFITYINTSLATLSQLGVGVSGGLVIEDDEAEWEDIWGEETPLEDQLSMIKTYIGLKVRMLFDPPSTSFHISAITEQITELEQRIHELRESLIPIPVDVVLVEEW